MGEMIRPGSGGPVPHPERPPVNYSAAGVENPFPGAPVWYTPETGSTMDDSETYLSTHTGERTGGDKQPALIPTAGTPPSGTVFWAGFQRTGKGRLPGRVWHGAPGQNLLFTLILHRQVFTRSPQLLPLHAGLALCRSLEREYGLAPQIKWPNDVLVRGKKCAGILCRMRGDRFLLGIGVNCNQVRFPEEIRSVTTSIKLETGLPADPAALLRALLENCLDVFRDPDWRGAVESRLAYRGRNVKVFIRGDEPEGFSAHVTGVDEEGRLRYRRPGRESEELLAAGEIRSEKETSAGG